jgi:hypothetical protein
MTGKAISEEKNLTEKIIFFKEVIYVASETNFYNNFLSHTLQVLPTKKLNKAFSSWQR